MMIVANTMKRMFTIQKFYYFVLWFSFVVTFFIFAHYSNLSKKSCQIEIDLETPKPVDFGIYYDIGEGFSQKHHQITKIDEVNKKVNVSFCTGPYNQLRSIRIDPAMEPIEMDIYSITLYFGNGTLFEVPLETLEPNDQIQEYSLSNGKLTFTTALGGNDPNFLLTSLKVDDVKVNIFDKIIHYGIWFLGACLLTGVVRFFVTFFILGK